MQAFRDKLMTNFMKYSILKKLFFLAIIFTAINLDSKAFALRLEITSDAEVDKKLIRKGFVNDFAKIFDESTKEKLEQTLNKFKSMRK